MAIAPRDPVIKTSPAGYKSRYGEDRMKSVRFGMTTAVAACAAALMGASASFAETVTSETGAAVAVTAQQALNSRTTVRWDLEGGNMRREIVESGFPFSKRIEFAKPALIGTIVMVNIWLFGSEFGAAMNPIRAFGPNIFYPSYWPFIWIYLLGPMMGCLAITLLFRCYKGREKER